MQKNEMRTEPKVVTVEEQMRQAIAYESWKREGNREGGLGDPSKIHGVKRLSILFRLPYWKVRYHMNFPDYVSIKNKWNV